MSKFVKLSDVAELTVGFVGTMAEHYETSGIPFLRSLNIKPFFIDNTDIKYISESFNKKLSKSILHTDDVVIVRTGLPGTCCVVPKQYDGCNCSDVVIVRPDKNKVDPHYLAAYINVWGQRQIHNNRVGAVQKHFNVHSAEELLILLPDIESQRKTAAFIKNLNGLILNNNQINDNLQHQIKLMYDYWFTQFDFPDENGKPYRSSGGAMVWNEQLKKHIPAEWKVTTALSAGIYTSDFTANGSFAGLAENVKYNEGTPYAILVRIVDYNNNFSEPDKFIYVNKHAYDYLKSCTLSGDEIIICNVGNVGITFRCPNLGMPMVLGPNGIVVNSKEYNDYLYMYYTSQEGQYRIQSISSGSIQKKFNKTDFRNMPLLLPPKEVNDSFKEQYHRLKVLCDNIWHENRKLTSLRDWLLPMLMNGQATIAD